MRFKINVVVMLLVVLCLCENCCHHQKRYVQACGNKVLKGIFGHKKEEGEIM